MKLLFLGNNNLGLQVLQWLRSKGVEVVGLVLNPPDKQRRVDEIVAASALPEERIIRGESLRSPEVLERVKGFGADIVLSCLCGHILKPEFLEIFGGRVYNLHPSLLPYSRGAFPNVWSIVERTPFGATLHVIDPGIDTGPIVAQVEVPVGPTDTGKTLYEKCERASFELLKENWPKLVSGEFTPQPQIAGEGTYHKVADISALDEIKLEQTYTGREIIDILRARTFPPYKGAYFTAEDGRKIYMRLELYEDE